MWVGGEFFVRLITDDEALVQTATQYLYIVPVSIGFMGMVNVANASFNALSKPAPPLVLSLTRFFVFYVPAAIFSGWQWNRKTIQSLRRVNYQ